MEQPLDNPYEYDVTPEHLGDAKAYEALTAPMHDNTRAKLKHEWDSQTVVFPGGNLEEQLADAKVWYDKVIAAKTEYLAYPDIDRTTEPKKVKHENINELRTLAGQQTHYTNITTQGMSQLATLQRLSTFTLIISLGTIASLSSSRNSLTFNCPEIPYQLLRLAATPGVSIGIWSNKQRINNATDLLYRYLRSIGFPMDKLVLLWDQDKTMAGETLFPDAEDPRIRGRRFKTHEIIHTHLQENTSAYFLLDRAEPDETDENRALGHTQRAVWGPASYITGSDGLHANVANLQEVFDYFLRVASLFHELDANNPHGGDQVAMQVRLENATIQLAASCPEVLAVGPSLHLYGPMIGPNEVYNPTLRTDTPQEQEHMRRCETRTKDGLHVWWTTNRDRPL